uniref:Uncharacterized protein n=1 Tax=Arundo donax TaxID=35708 RepID=A0A0A8YLB0_ARUDO
MLTNLPVKGAYDIRQEVPIGVFIRLLCLALRSLIQSWS